MTILRVFLLAATVVIFAITIYAVATKGINWPAVFFGDLPQFDWRSQFNTDFLIHLILLGDVDLLAGGVYAKRLHIRFFKHFFGWYVWISVSARSNISGKGRP